MSRYLTGISSYRAFYVTRMGATVLGETSLGAEHVTDFDHGIPEKPHAEPAVFDI